MTQTWFLTNEVVAQISPASEDHPDQSSFHPKLSLGNQVSNTPSFPTCSDVLHVNIRELKAIKARVCLHFYFELRWTVSILKVEDVS